MVRATHSRSTPAQILDRVRHEIIEAHGYIQEDAVFFVSDPDDLGAATEANETITIFVGKRWRFDAGQFGGAGEYYLTTTIPLTITLWMVSAGLDEMGRSEILLFKKTDGGGLIELQAARLLRTLANNPLIDPRDKTVKHLKEGIVPDEMQWDTEPDDATRGYVRLNFAATFNWDLKHNSDFESWPKPRTE